MSELDDRLRAGAYIRTGNTVYENKGITEAGAQYTLENIVGVKSEIGGEFSTYVHERIVRTAAEIMGAFQLVKAAPPDDLESVSVEAPDGPPMVSNLTEEEFRREFFDPS